MEGSVVAGRYEVQHKIATGGMAEIYLARLQGEGSFSKRVVLKRLHPELAPDGVAREFFLREARISALLSHPNIVQVYDVTRHDEDLFIVMEYIIGQELRGVVRKSIAAGALLPLPHVLTIIHQAAQALHYAHTIKDENNEPLDLVHRDVTPTNLLITMEGIVKLVDFGVAWIRGEEDVSAERRILPGKMNYMAPELLKGEKPTPKADIFSLGVILYELAVGRRLFKGKGDDVRKRILDGRIPPPTSVKKGMDPELELLILKAIEKDPYHRYESAEEFALELERYAINRGFALSPVALSRYLRGLFFPELFREEAEEYADEELDLDRRAGLLDEWRDDSEEIAPHGVELPGVDGLSDEELLEILGDPDKAREFFESQMRGRKREEHAQDDSGAPQEQKVVLLTKRKKTTDMEKLMDEFDGQDDGSGSGEADSPDHGAGSSSSASDSHAVDATEDDSPMPVSDERDVPVPTGGSISPSLFAAAVGAALAIGLVLGYLIS